METIGSETKAARPLRILIVDDQRDTTDALCVLLAVLGQEVRTAQTAAEALHLVREYAPDMLLLDIGLPDLDGYEVARRLRASGTTDLYIAAMTGWCSEEDRARAFAAGCNLHVPKPVDVELVRAAVRAANDHCRGFSGAAGARRSTWRTKHRSG